MTVRVSAAGASSTFALRAGKRREEIVRALVRALERDPQRGVVEEAFRGLGALLPGTLPQIDVSRLSAEEIRGQVNWSLLAKYQGH